MRHARAPLSLVFLAGLAAAAPSAAQQGAIAGRVIDAATLEPVSPATVSVVRGGPPMEVPTRSDGSFMLALRAGVYDLLVEAEGFTSKRFERVQVSGGQTTGTNLPLVSQFFRLGGFVVTASRGTVDTEITAPSSSHSVGEREIARRPVLSPAEHLRQSPGVDILTEGVQSSNVVLRGFNNIFSGALHMLTDFRQAALPALRVNYMHWLPLNDLDVERMELVLGPGSALYGPNTSSGVLHLITRSPLESPGSSASLAAGERGTVHGAFRSAFRVNDRLAVKVSGEALRADEWPYQDSTEIRFREQAEADPALCILDRASRGLDPAAATNACNRIGRRDYGVRRISAEARADWRYSPRGTLTGAYGVSDMTGIELTGLGAAQIQDWIHQYAQARFSYDRWSIQAYFNFNDSGDQAFQLRDGTPLVDRSTVGAFQIQNGFSIAGGRQDFTYGYDYFSTRPQSRGTIYGDFEGDNSIREWGAYLQSRTNISPKLDLVAAGRIDSHSILPELIFSPRAALVFKPSERHAIRVSYNQAFSTPTALNYFLDLGTGFAPDPGLASLGYTLRAFGSGREGWALQNADGTLRGMRSPFNPAGAGNLLPADAATLWALGVGVAPGLPGLAGTPIPGDILAILATLTPGASDVGIRFNDPGGPLSVTIRDIEPVREENTETFELGWSGVVGDRLRVAADVYYRKQNNFVSPLTVVTPVLFLDGAGLEQWLLGAYAPVRAAQLVDSLGISQADADAQAAAEAATWAPRLAAALGPIPLGVASSDVPEMANGGADLIVTYRNIGGLDLWGADLALEWLLSPRWTVSGTYSHVSRDWFEIEGASPVALNAPRHKGSVGVAFRDEARGLDASARVRYTGAHPFKSTNYDGTGCLPGLAKDPYTIQEDCIDAFALVDLTVGYRIPRSRATLQAGVSNLLDTPYRSMVGAPSVGRLAMVRVRYDFF